MLVALWSPRCPFVDPPVERLSAEQALEHPLFAYFREIDEEPRVRADVPFDASFEMYDLGALGFPEGEVYWSGKSHGRNP